MNKPIVIMFGGISPEHEVSVISGLQIVESIDREVYEPHVVYVTKQGELHISFSSSTPPRYKHK